MNIQVQISDEVYKSLVAGGNRVKGTIALVSPNEGNFNAWRTSNGKREIRRYIKLPHGRASVGMENVRLHLCIDREETDVVPASAIISESAKASAFIDRVIPISW
ncbi:hypothetical protein JQM97_07780 [Prevotella hominis]|uniref:hypothetical protein n=1 Tax=Segatella hominis TaxID=2518605 RepID=UPI001F1B28F5|nr:hypothetical protein [Segatella hominis]MCF2590827.1 hypothetical protein [Segatella hominis]